MDAATGKKRFGTGRRALVTGGAGFLGTHLCQRLLRDGWQVTAVDNLATGSMDNVAALRDQPGYRFMRHDVTEPLNVAAERIFNLACCASPVHYQEDPIKTMRTCLDGAANLLDLARANNATIFQASTSEVYGEPEVHPQHESYRGAVSTTGPRACYDEGKRCAETLFFDYHRLHGTRIKVGRIFNTYGPRMQASDGRVVSNLIVQALRNEPMTLNGDGSQTRSFCYVDDLVEAMVRIMDTPDDFTGPVNLGNPSEITVAELAEIIIRLTGTRSKIVHRKMPVDDPTRRCPDISLARSAMDWQPVVPLEEGLQQTIAWFDRCLSESELATREERRGVA
ncbi:UDP-glucuronic acid decarboxylase family protein [Novilysobacter defluvii]|uniref:NAD-dependent epimerase/dehydratase domain-containing protein n=1 Tax=Lysobacter defluvii IMMIB APB-9 = DSM 18482 TaxID=1385515 RepID=A0A0A0M8G3_9GAMM|nr:UDP-glucuronic acid decarboxylase family protein [Lysobacter defluvii]KGO98489.1 hypothetical protein N791_14680 [Lysobacter defluvii IMMIB APB-9 = DSM 18482]